MKRSKGAKKSWAPSEKQLRSATDEICVSAKIKNSNQEKFLNFYFE